MFEQSLGSLLRFALNHIEALQILDLPEFTQHVREILTRALASEKPLPEGEKLQDTMALFYLGSLGAKMEEMDEDRVMDLIIENGLIKLMILHLNKHFAWYKVDALTAACVFLSQCFNSETYSTEKGKIFADKELISKLVALKGSFVADLVASHGVKKKEIQKLLDELEKFEKIVGAAAISPFKPREEAKAPAVEKKEEKKETPAGPSATGGLPGPWKSKPAEAKS